MNRDADQGSNILVVDDTVENLRLVSGMLANRGFDVRPVTSGAEALQAIAHDPPDLILLDVSMPGMNGLEVCTTLKQHAQWREIPVIFLTALSEVGDKVKGFEVGGADYITKPFQLDEVVARVTHQLALRQARRQLTESFERLQALERLRDDLVNMIVHDMRSPLTALTINLDYAKSQVTGDLHDALRDAVGSAQGLADMCNTLLDVSRLEDGKMPLDKAPCDLAAIAAQACAAMASIDARRTIDLVLSGPVIASCDPQLIRRVLENLIGNAIKHTPAGGHLRIEVKTEAGAARISVQDEGPGIPPDAREKIFEKFGTVAARKDQHYHSAGLGLAFCKLAVQAHDGRIGIDAATPRGSIFWFELPA